MNKDDKRINAAVEKVLSKGIPIQKLDDMYRQVLDKADKGHGPFHLFGKHDGKLSTAEVGEFVADALSKDHKPNQATKTIAKYLTAHGQL